MFAYTHYVYYTHVRVYCFQHSVEIAQESHGNVECAFATVGIKRGKLYFLNCSSYYESDRSLVCDSSNSALWHKRYCHLGYDNLQKLITKNLVTGMDCGPCDTKFFCENCCEGKLHRSPFPTFNGERVKREFLDLIHIDVCGKILLHLEGQITF